MMGIVIEDSLIDTKVLDGLEIIKSWDSGSWKLHKVNVSKDQAWEFQNYFQDGPWYVHFWEDGSDDMLVVYKDKIFEIKFSDKDTWGDAVQYGLSIGIPEKQLSFPIDQD